MKSLSRTEHTILDLLRSRHRMYGLEMVHASKSLKRGSIYVTLERMTDKGLVSSYQEKKVGQPGLPRRLYEITGHGAKVLNAHEAFESALASDEMPSGFGTATRGLAI